MENGKIYKVFAKEIRSACVYALENSISNNNILHVDEIFSRSENVSIILNYHSGETSRIERVENIYIHALHAGYH